MLDGRLLLCARTETVMFIVQSHQRCGTHMLRSALNSHRRVTCYGEVFHTNWIPECGPLPKCERTPHAVMAHCLSRKKQTGFVVHVMETTQPHWHCLPAGCKVVTLYRRNLLARHVSWLIALKTDKWNVTAGQPYEPVKVRVDLPVMLEDFETTRWAYELQTLRAPASLRLSYEELCSGGLQRVLLHLGVESTVIEPATLKMGRPLAESVTNYRQVQAVLAGTRFAEFLE